MVRSWLLCEIYIFAKNEILKGFREWDVGNNIGDSLDEMPIPSEIIKCEIPCVMVISKSKGPKKNFELYKFKVWTLGVISNSRNQGKSSQQFRGTRVRSIQVPLYLHDSNNEC